MVICLAARRIWTHGLGGMETHCQSLAAELARRRHVVHVVTTAHPSGRTDELQLGARIHYLPATPAGDYSRAWWRASRRWAEDHLKALGVDAVISMSLAARAIAAVPNAPPVFFIIHGYGWSQIRSFWHDSQGWRRLLEFPYHATQVVFRMVWSRPVLRRAAGVIAVSQELCHQLRRFRAQLVPNVVDTAVFRPDPGQRVRMRAALGISDDDVVALVVGTVNRQKGVDVALDVCADLAMKTPALRVVVIGDGPALEPLGHWVRTQAPHLRVTFLGPQPNEALPPYYAAADIFLFPSRRQEGLPTTVLEAMASGLPVVATRSGGTPTAVRHGETGLVTAIGDARAFGLALRGLVGDPARRHALGAAARRVAEEVFDVHAVVGRLVDLIRGARC